jgi:hypothetical protein
MRHVALLTCLAVICLAAAPRPLRVGDPLQGDWPSTLTPSGSDANMPGVREFKDTLTFTPTQFSSKYLKDHGFKPADYDEDVRAYGPAKFKSTQTSDKEGKAEWEGVVDANQITGTLKWTKKDGTVVHYDIQGSLKGTDG